MEHQPQGPVLLSVTVLLHIVSWMVLIAAIGMGAMHLDSCPAQPYIPVYLIVLGVSSLLSLVFTYMHQSREEDTEDTLNSACFGVLNIFNFCWFVAGSVWVYAIWPPNYSTGEDGYCQKTVYQLAFFFTSLYWVVGISRLLYGGYLLLLTCPGMASRQHDLSHHQDTSYGAASSA